MPYDPKIHHRRSTRLPYYDYSQAGLYFVTICTQHKICLFGSILDGKMNLNAAGSMVEQAWLELSATYEGIQLDEFVVMPNHLHGVLFLVSEDENDRLPLGEVIKRFKTWTLTKYIDGVRNHDWQRFPGRLWQRNFHDRVIRDEREIDNIRRYIRQNPLAWQGDEHHPSSLGVKPKRGEGLPWESFEESMSDGNDGGQARGPAPTGTLTRASGGQARGPAPTGTLTRASGGQARGPAPTGTLTRPSGGQARGPAPTGTLTRPSGGQARGPAPTGTLTRPSGGQARGPAPTGRCSVLFKLTPQELWDTAAEIEANLLGEISPERFRLSMPVEDLDALMNCFQELADAGLSGKPLAVTLRLLGDQRNASMKLT